ncbi:MAG: lactate utilization protein [Thermodesulfobacteriota bacterium]
MPPDQNAILNLIEILGKNNIPAFYLESRAEAFDKVMAMIPEGSTVGFGDSLTLREIGVVMALEEGPYHFLNPWEKGITVEESIRRKRQGLIAEVFVSGSNALTLDGKIVNVDGHGNRVAALLFGPERVIIVIGVNKIVKNLEEALARIRDKAAPLNVKRHPEFDPQPPCGVTGECSDCSSPWRICNKTVIIERQFNNNKYKPVLSLIMVGETLGL